MKNLPIIRKRNKTTTMAMASDQSNRTRHIHNLTLFLQRRKKRTILFKNSFIVWYSHRSLSSATVSNRGHILLLCESG
jgi:hypothetical protein